MLAPRQVRIKRKRTEAPPDELVVEHSNSHNLTFNQRANQVLYRLGAVKHASRTEGKPANLRSTASSALPPDEANKGHHDPAATDASDSPRKRQKRVYHLSHKDAITITRSETTVGQRLDDGATKLTQLATFEQLPVASVDRQPQLAVPADAESATTPLPTEMQPLKRPSKGLAVSGAQPKFTANQDAKDGATQEDLHKIATNLQSFALHELPKVTRPTVTVVPRFAGRRRDMTHAIASNPEPRIRDDEIMDVDSHADFVFDTYTLAPDGDVSSIINLDNGNVGYLVITDEDQAVWEQYIDEQISDAEYDTDDADSNAEDFYGADYPDDELASDDEHDRGAYGYRAHGASDDEEWNSDTGAYSDDEWNKLYPWRK
ncbi:hypothetical protein BAUCODRAFT_31335 [Baudoinia panamericana UAMH 10762]|uniref:Transcription factor Iwr1 domain-containing protein n=1 Tax=Baudoinia panamericana (strain UAMH 10762) TaxID=717646 RepID=M2LWM1_BAUPA|nr:uncharacterized protein BAUCODRAFT_31335 [Baudoinia panamericana UAMH 10762]EMC99052.1 hypothetical protein BAUCODRAFT_31335 [Baudoinia panamericana UAMH 10762]